MRNPSPFLKFIYSLPLLLSALFYSQTIQANETPKALLKQDAQRYAVCAATGNKEQKQHFSEKLFRLLQKQNNQQDKLPADKLQQLSKQKIERLERNYREYSIESKNTLFNKVCRNLKQRPDENFVGLQIQELPESLQNKIRTIAKCTILSNSYGKRQQARKLALANTLIIVAAGLNGKNQAMQQLKKFHLELSRDLNKLSKDELQYEFKTSCNQVKKMQTR